MAQPVDVYVDPSINADSGSGTSGNPYGDLQYALNQTTRSTNGNRFNIKAGAAEVLTGGLSTTTYGTPTIAGPLIFQGYTSTANDGGKGEISGNGSYGVFPTSKNATAFIDLHCHNCGSSVVINLSSSGFVAGCEIDNTTGNGIVTGAESLVIGNNVHNVGGVGISMGGDSNICMRNYLKNGTNDFSDAIRMGSNNRNIIMHNVVSVDGSTNGIVVTGDTTKVIGNSVLSSSAGTGSGIKAGNYPGIVIVNCLVEGFSGVGGIGINYNTSATRTRVTGHNGVYNCMTSYSTAHAMADLGDNEALSASPFAKSGADTYANVLNYFQTADTGNVREGAFPTGLRWDKGAIQRQ